MGILDNLEAAWDKEFQPELNQPIGEPESNDEHKTHE